MGGTSQAHRGRGGAREGGTVSEMGRNMTAVGTTVYRLLVLAWSFAVLKRGEGKRCLRMDATPPVQVWGSWFAAFGLSRFPVGLHWPKRFSRHARGFRLYCCGGDATSGGRAARFNVAIYSQHLGGLKPKLRFLLLLVQLRVHTLQPRADSFRQPNTDRWADKWNIDAKSRRLCCCCLREALAC